MTAPHTITYNAEMSVAKPSNGKTYFTIRMLLAPEEISAVRLRLAGSFKAAMPVRQCSIGNEPTEIDGKRALTLTSHFLTMDEAVRLLEESSKAGILCNAPEPFISAAFEARQPGTEIQDGDHQGKTGPNYLHIDGINP